MPQVPLVEVNDIASVPPNASRKLPTAVQLPGVAHETAKPVEEGIEYCPTDPNEMATGVDHLPLIDDTAIGVPLALLPTAVQSPGAAHDTE